MTAEIILAFVSGGISGVLATFFGMIYLGTKLNK